MTKKKVNEQYRQGDVLVERCEEKLKEELVEVPKEGGRVVLAHGEATGHAHAIAGKDAKLLDARQTMRRILRVIAKGTSLVHEEHHRPDIGQVTALEKGDYRVIRQREYSEEEIRRVAD